EPEWCSLQGPAGHYDCLKIHKLEPGVGAEWLELRANPGITGNGVTVGPALVTTPSTTCRPTPAHEVHRIWGKYPSNCHRCRTPSTCRCHNVSSNHRGCGRACIRHHCFRMWS